ncbi:MAG TPA: lipopolysaccharide heptosyltransferase II [Candidatus Acidoferrales bacterium]|nr:lipopolysaccharide heptosyltransferase II [Candidatus Acidoferrales bacterium]
MRILLRATNWVGDAVMSIPALDAVRARWPQAEITIAGRQAIIDLYRGQPFADRLVPLGGNGAQAARGERFDLGIVLPNSFASAWQVWRAGARERVGYARDARRWLLNRPVSRPRPGEIPPHECYYYLELLRRAGWIAELPRIERIRLRVGPEAVARASARLEALGARAPRVALAAGASYGAAKCWLPERFAEVADRLCAEFGASIVLVGTAAECEIGRRIAATMRHPPADLTGHTSTAELPALAAACRLFVGNDSGAMHVAAAVGLPVIAVFGSTDPGGTAPATPDRTIVRHRVSCSPCFLRYCPVDHRCMMRVTVEEVFRAAANGMQGNPAQ